MDKADSTEIGVSASYNQAPRYIKDIQNLKSTETIDEQTHEIKGIYCFDGSSSYMGTLIYLQTNKGTYVKYYEYPDSEPLLFPENKFIEYGTAYYQYLISYENNYNEFGESLFGGALTFASFIDDYLNNSKAEKQNIQPKIIVITVIGISIITGALIITTKFLNKKRHSN